MASLSELPDELLDHISQFLSVQSLAAFNSLCKRIYSLTSTDETWCAVVRGQYGKSFSLYTPLLRCTTRKQILNYFRTLRYWRNGAQHELSFTPNHNPIKYAPIHFQYIGDSEWLVVFNRITGRVESWNFDSGEKFECRNIAVPPESVGASAFTLFESRAYICVGGYDYKQIYCWDLRSPHAVACLDSAVSKRLIDVDLNMVVSHYLVLVSFVPLDEAALVATQIIDLTVTVLAFDFRSHSLKEITAKDIIFADVMALRAIPDQPLSVLLMCKKVSSMINVETGGCEKCFMELENRTVTEAIGNDLFVHRTASEMGCYRLSTGELVCSPPEGFSVYTGSSWFITQSFQPQQLRQKKQCKAFRVTADGSLITCSTQFADAFVSYGPLLCSVSPDVCLSHMSETEIGQHELTLRTSMFSQDRVKYPYWSPEGSFIAVISAQSPKITVWRIPPPQ